MAGSFQSRKPIRGQLANALEPFPLTPQFILAESPECLRLQTLNLLPHEPFEFIADFLEAATIHKKKAVVERRAHRSHDSGESLMALPQRTLTEGHLE